MTKIKDDINVNSDGLAWNVELVLRGPDGKIKTSRVHNTVTTAGKTGIAAQCATTPGVGKPTHMAIGTGTGGTTTLNTELDRNAVTSSTSSGAVLTVVGTWNAGDGTGALTEAGIFDATPAGNMWCYTTFSVINKAAGDSLVITWTLTVS